jgi:hypothetical protein
MKRFPKIGIVVLTILWVAGSYFSAFASTGVSVATVPVPEPVSMILLGAGLIALAGFGRRWG